MDAFELAESDVTNGSDPAFSCAVSAFDIDFVNAVRGAGMATASLSILGSLAIILTYVKWRDMRTLSRSLLVCISVADFFTAAGNLAGQAAHLDQVDGVLYANASASDVYTAYHPPLCVAQSFVTTTSSLSSFFWTCIMACYLHNSIVHMRAEGMRAGCYRISMHLVGWGLPLLLGVIAVSMGALGADRQTADSAGWCFIRGSHGDSFTKREKMVWRLMVGKAWEILTYLIMSVLYIKIRIFISRNDKHQTFVTHGSIKAIREIDKKFIMVPAIFLVIRIWGTIRFFLSLRNICNDTAAHRHADMAFLMLQSIGDSSQGLANCILFVIMTKKVRRRLKRLLCCSGLQADADTERAPIMQYQSRGGGAAGARRSNRRTSTGVGINSPTPFPPQAGSVNSQNSAGRHNPGSPARSPSNGGFLVGGGVFVDLDRRASDESSDDNAVTDSMIHA